MPTRVLTVTGTSPAAATAARTMFSNSRRRHGTADPPPLRGTLGTGQPKLRATGPGRRRPAALAGPLGPRAAEVGVDVCRAGAGVALVDQHLHGAADGGRVDP